MARRTATDAPPERARAARTALAEPRSRGSLRARVMSLCVCSYTLCAAAAVGRIDVLRRPNDHRASRLRTAFTCVEKCINFGRMGRGLALKCITLGHAGAVMIAHDRHTL